MSETTAFEGARILTVDDEADVRTFLDDVLSRQGARVFQAATGAEALGLCTNGCRYDLVLLELVLPDMDGTRVLQEIRARDESVPVVMITGGGGVESATEAVRMGADGYIEKQRLVEEECSAFLYALEQAVEHRAGFVAQRQLQETRAQFYSMVTHDLRNPAGNLAGIVKLLQSGKAGPLTPRQDQLLEIARTSAEKLVGLIDDYLDYATIDAGYLRLERREADLRDVVREVARQAGPQAGVRQQTVVLDLPREPVRGCVDAERLGQVLDNLVSNAIKYTPEEGWITLALAAEGGDAVFTVKDTGRGIPPEVLPRLFSRYQRAGGEATRGIRGTGLGLLIVKEIAEAHGGSVQVESEGVPGRGSTFTVRIPLRPPGSSACPAPADP